MLAIRLNMRTLRSLFLLFAAIISLTDAKAQDLENKEDTKKVGSTFRATLFNIWGGPQLYVQENKKYVTINPAKYSYSSRYRYKDNVTVFFEKITTAEGEEQYKPVIRVPIPITIEEPLIVLFWNTKTKKPLAKAIEFSPKKFKFGTYQIINFSDKPIAGYIGKKTNKILCKPASSYITSFNFQSGERTPIVFYAKEGDQMKKVFGSMTIHKDRKRAIYLMYGEINKLKQLVYQGTVIVDFKKIPPPL